jgi:hypothetical protein
MDTTGQEKKGKTKTKLDRRRTRRTKNNAMTEDSGELISEDASEN